MDILTIAQGLVKPFGRDYVEVGGLLRELRDIVIGTAAYAAAEYLAREERERIP